MQVLLSLIERNYLFLGKYQMPRFLRYNTPKLHVLWMYGDFRKVYGLEEKKFNNNLHFTGTSGRVQEEVWAYGEGQSRSDGREQAIVRATPWGQGTGGPSEETIGQLWEGQGNTQSTFSSLDILFIKEREYCNSLYVFSNEHLQCMTYIILFDKIDKCFNPIVEFVSQFHNIMAVWYLLWCTVIVFVDDKGQAKGDRGGAEGTQMGTRGPGTKVWKGRK